MQCPQAGSALSARSKKAQYAVDSCRVGDAAADAFVQELKSTLISQHQSAGTVVGGDALKPSTHSLLSLVQASPACKAFMAECYSVPSWVDWARIASGQRFFVKNALGASLVLLHSSLAAGFASPRIAEVLACTGYMSTSVEST
jgi:hypothetical protein